MPASPITRQRVISRQTPIIGFTGVALVDNAVFDATTLTADSNGRYILPSGSILTKSTSDPTKVKIFANAGTNANDVQTIAETGSPTGGTFTLTFGGQTTAAIPYNATATQVASALQALTSIGYGNVTVTGGALPGTNVVVTFVNELGNMAQSAMTHTDSLTGGTTPAVTITHTTTGSTGEAVYGIYGGPDKDFWGNTVACDEAIAAYRGFTAFNTALIPNWNLYGELVTQALSNCEFRGA